MVPGVGGQPGAAQAVDELVDDLDAEIPGQPVHVRPRPIFLVLPVGVAEDDESPIFPGLIDGGLVLELMQGTPDPDGEHVGAGGILHPVEQSHLPVGIGGGIGIQVVVGEAERAVAELPIKRGDRVHRIPAAGSRAGTGMGVEVGPDPPAA